MKVVQVNVDLRGSIGKINLAVSKLLTETGIENYIVYALGPSSAGVMIKYSNLFEEKISALFSRVFGNSGFNSTFATFKLIKVLDKIKPDIVHLHNLHSHNVNLTMLFNYLKNKEIKVFWTFHDCWAFTGYCTHYSMISCLNWMNECGNCPQYKKYSWFFDKSTKQINKKIAAMHDADLTIITPSKWLANEVKKSAIKDKSVVVINNGIDLNTFFPRTGFNPKLDINLNKYVVLGVAYKWTFEKGVDVFIKMASDLSDKFQIVLVGTDEDTEKMLPSNIVSIHRTKDQNELAELYSRADVFVNPTREDTYPTVNLEALACGTPIVSFNTGGCPETFDDTCGILIEKEDYSSMVNAVRYICEQKPFSQESCLSRVYHNSDYNCFKEYIDLYMHNSVCKENDEN